MSQDSIERLCNILRSKYDYLNIYCECNWADPAWSEYYDTWTIDISPKLHLDCDIPHMQIVITKEYNTRGGYNVSPGYNYMDATLGADRADMEFKGGGYFDKKLEVINFIKHLVNQESNGLKNFYNEWR